MIYWLLESAQNMTEAPEAFLSAAELEKFSAFRFEKRRSDWLLGRWTAKRLLQAILLQRTNEMIARDAFEIFNDADGVPHIATLRVAHGEHSSPDLEGLRISISHSNAYALCAVSEGMIGADLEFVEPREEYLTRDYFTANEQARVHAASPAQRDIVVTAIWSAKEAALKAVRKGLSVDTRAVEISLAPFAAPPAQWMPFEIKLNFENAETHNGWWRVQEGFVLTVTSTTLTSTTIASTTNDAPDEFPLSPEISLIELGVKNGQGHGMLPHGIAHATRHHARHSQGH